MLLSRSFGIGNRRGLWKLSMLLLTKLGFLLRGYGFGSVWFFCFFLAKLLFIYQCVFRRVLNWSVGVCRLTGIWLPMGNRRRSWRRPARSSWKSLGFLLYVSPFKKSLKLVYTNVYVYVHVCMFSMRCTYIKKKKKNLLSITMTQSWS